MRIRDIAEKIYLGQMKTLSPDHFAQMRNIWDYMKDRVHPDQIFQFLDTLDAIYETMEDAGHAMPSLSPQDREWIVISLVAQFVEQIQINREMILLSLNAPSTDL